MPSPMPFLLDLHDMKLVNFRTAVRYNLRRIDNSDNIQDGKVMEGRNVIMYIPAWRPYVVR